MPRPRTSLFYRNRIAQLTEEGYRAPAIARKLAEEAAKEDRYDNPNERTVRRIREAHLNKKPEERVDSEPFYWPDSMVKAGLPWEASRTILDLIRHWYEAWGTHPWVRIVKWYWRIHLAAPNAPYGDKITAANHLEQSEGWGDPSEYWDIVRAVEAYLAFASWEAPDEESWLVIMRRLFDAYSLPEDSLFERARPGDLAPDMFSFIAVVSKQRRH